MKSEILPEFLLMLAFIIYLLGSSIALITHGVELSLWIMTLAVFINIMTTILPWLGIHWLALDKKGSMTGYWIALILRLASWSSFTYAMYWRLWRILPDFYTWITITTLLWGVSALLFIYSRHVCKVSETGDKLEDNKNQIPFN